MACARLPSPCYRGLPSLSGASGISWVKYGYASVSCCRLLGRLRPWAQHWALGCCGQVQFVLWLWELGVVGQRLKQNLVSLLFPLFLAQSLLMGVLVHSRVWMGLAIYRLLQLCNFKCMYALIQQFHLWECLPTETFASIAIEHTRGYFSSACFIVAKK